MGIFGDHYLGSSKGFKNSNKNFSELLTLFSRFITSAEREVKDSRRSGMH